MVLHETSFDESVDETAFSETALTKWCLTKCLVSAGNTDSIMFCSTKGFVLQKALLYKRLCSNARKIRHCSLTCGLSGLQRTKMAAI